MKLKLTKRDEKPKGAPFQDVEVGRLFLDSFGRLMIKRGLIQIADRLSHGRYNATSLHDGYMQLFDDAGPVTILEDVEVIYSVKGS